MTLTLESARLRLLVVTFAAAALTVGCGGGSVLQSTTGPSGTANSDTLSTASAAGGASSASNADVFDTLDKGGNPGGKKPGDAGESEHGKEPGEAGDHGRGHDDRVVGFVSAKFGGTLTVNGVTVAGGPGVVIRHGNRTLTMADIQVGDHIQARGTMDGTTLVASEIKVEDTGNDNDDHENAAELKGTVSAFSGAATCPAATFMIGTTKVTTSATTVFDDVTCATLANGAIVEVEGAKQADGSILATKVEAEAGPDEVEGMIFGLAGTGSCPALTFKVGSTLATATTVNTNSSTTFNGVACTALANGARVEVEGTKQADGSITAASVELH
jgi:Domain of unknown function (DUF5666)